MQLSHTLTTLTYIQWTQWYFKSPAYLQYLESIFGMINMCKLKVEKEFQAVFQRRVNNINKVSLKFSRYGYNFISIVFGKLKNKPRSWSSTKTHTRSFIWAGAALANSVFSGSCSWNNSTEQNPAMGPCNKEGKWDSVLHYTKLGSSTSGEVIPLIFKQVGKVILPL